VSIKVNVANKGPLKLSGPLFATTGVTSIFSSIFGYIFTWPATAGKPKRNIAMQVQTWLKDLADLSDEEAQAIHYQLISFSCKKNTLLLKQGHSCEYIYFIEKGFARAFYSKNGKDATTWFARENDIITSMYALITNRKSNESIEILEDASLFRISYKELQTLYKIYPNINRLGRILMEKYFVELEERTLSLQFDSALERYQRLIAQQPYVLQRASLGQIASFLGMSQITLSRIRGNR
jgi:CRP/FNR family transcriptional regulator, anaerobic regulatory protein